MRLSVSTILTLSRSADDVRRRLGAEVLGAFLLLQRLLTLGRCPYKRPRAYRESVRGALVAVAGMRWLVVTEAESA